MAEYIEREAAIAYLKEHKKKGVECGVMLAADEDAIIKFLQLKCPTVDAVEVVHGWWVCLESEIGYYACSKCGHRILRAKCNYCPDCGTKMDGKVSEDAGKCYEN